MGRDSRIAQNPLPPLMRPQFPKYRQALLSGVEMYGGGLRPKSQHTSQLLVLVQDKTTNDSASTGRVAGVAHFNAGLKGTVFHCCNSSLSTVIPLIFVWLASLR